MNQRIRIIQIFFALWVVVIIGKLAYWQIVKAEELKTQAEFQQMNRYFIPAPRGRILASDGQPLVSNKVNYRLVSDPSLLPNDLTQLKNLLKESGSSESSILAIESLKASKLRWAVLEKEITPQTKTKIDQLKISGLFFEESPSRIHPEGSPSAYITGFVGRSSTDQPQGFFGLEGYYDRMLSGSPGKTVEEKDAFGMPIIIGSRLEIPPQPGKDLTTSIDRVIQHAAYIKLKEGLEKYQAISGSVTVLDSQTGHVLAMVSLPTYDPDKYVDFDQSLLKNPIVSESYEPGSTFKSIVMASGLDAGVIKPNTMCDICEKPLLISGQLVRNYDNKYYPQTTMTDVILHSDNVGMVYVARKLGKSNFLNYLQKFGIGEVTGIDQQEESISELRSDNEWYEIDWSTAAFGQGIAVTPMQIVTAVNCIARLGECISPKIVTDPTQNSKKWRAISPSAAREITAMMTNGVENGAVKVHKPKGYVIAGKTGTAQVPIEGHYDEDKTIASFIGFAPVPNPKFTMLVTVREPKTSPWGSTTAAPIWFEIAKEIFRLYKIPGQSSPN